jgi:hypothetical protein
MLHAEAAERRSILVHSRASSRLSTESAAPQSPAQTRPTDGAVVQRACTALHGSAHCARPYGVRSLERRCRRNGGNQRPGSAAFSPRLAAASLSPRVSRARKNLTLGSESSDSGLSLLRLAWRARRAARAPSHWLAVNADSTASTPSLRRPPRRSVAKSRAPSAPSGERRLRRRLGAEQRGGCAVRTDSSCVSRCDFHGSSNSFRGAKRAKGASGACNTAVYERKIKRA